MENNINKDELHFGFCKNKGVRVAELDLGYITVLMSDFPFKLRMYLKV